MSKKNEKFTEITNNKTYQYYYNWLKLIATNAIKWENVPDTIDIRFLENILFENGQIAFFNDSPLGFLAMPINATNTFDPYGNPLKYSAYSPYTTYRNLDLNNKNSVIIYNNYLRTSSKQIVEMFAYKLYNLSRTIDVNVSAQRTPIVIMCDQKSRLTLENLVAKYDGNEPFIFLNENLNIEGVKVLDTKAPFVADKLEIQIRNTINDFLSNYGIENGNAEKKERMTSQEVGANYGVVEKGRNIYLTPRYEACKKINLMFGLDISVSFNTDLITLINQPISSLGDDINV